MIYFQHILRQRLKLCHKPIPNTQTNLLKDIRNIFGEYPYEPHLLCSGEDCYDQDILYEYCRNPKLRDITAYVMKKIVLPYNLQEKTYGVRLRIAVGMFNKVKFVTRTDDNLSFRQWIHSNLVRNANASWYIRMGWDDLPF